MENASLSIFVGKQPQTCGEAFESYEKREHRRLGEMGYNEERDESQVGKREWGEVTPRVSAR